MHVDESPAVRSLVAALQKLCTKLPGAEQYVMVHHPAFRVGKKPFAIVGMDERKAGATLSINLGKDEQPLLLDDPRFWRTPYIGQHGWVTVPDGKLSAAERQTLVADSWRRIAGKRRIAEWEAQSR